MQRHRDLVAAVQADAAAMDAALQGFLASRSGGSAGAWTVVQTIPHTKISQLARPPLIPRPQDDFVSEAVILASITIM
jgi:hypothetical protein